MSFVAAFASPRENARNRRNPHRGAGLLRFLYHLHSIMTPGDRILFFVLLGISLLSILGLRFLLAPGHTASVFVANRLVKNISLGKSEIHHIIGTIGTIELRIAENGVSVIHSECPEKICIKQGVISRQGQIIVCVPNQMIIIVDGEAGRSLDAVTP